MTLREWIRRFMPGPSDRDLEAEMRFHLAESYLLRGVAVSNPPLKFTFLVSRHCNKDCR